MKEPKNSFSPLPSQPDESEAFRRDFPAESKWDQVQSIRYSQAPEKASLPLVSIQVRDHTGAPSRVWMEMPNAMYLMNLLLQLQMSTKAAVPTTAPPRTSP